MVIIIILVDNIINTNVVCKTVLSNNESVKNTVINTLINVPNVVVPDNLRRSLSPIINDDDDGVSSESNSATDLDDETVGNRKSIDNKKINSKRKYMSNTEKRERRGRKIILPLLYIIY